ncbi:MAG: hypothetical protein AABX68_00715 [Nanoarchaeota archaeon]
MLQYQLYQEQHYVLDIAEELGIEPKMVCHKRPTVSCAEKLDMLKEDDCFSDWTLDRIVKAMYFTRGSSPFIEVITPEFERNVKPKEIFPYAIKISRGAAEKYWINPKRTPKGMVWGTCSPFPFTSSVGKEISDIIFLDHPSINEKLVDISIGGKSKEMFQISMHIPYRAIYNILKKQFGDRVHLV